LRTQAIGNRFGRIDRSVQILCYFLKSFKKFDGSSLLIAADIFLFLVAIFGGKVQGF